MIQYAGNDYGKILMTFTLTDEERDLPESNNKVCFYGSSLYMIM